MLITEMNVVYYSSIKRLHIFDYFFVVDDYECLFLFSFFFFGKFNVRYTDISVNKEDSIYRKS